MYCPAEHEDSGYVHVSTTDLRRLENAEYSVRRFSELNLELQNRIYRHSMFAYPHLWLWHAMFDGTWLCRCWRSKEMRS